MFTRKLSPVTTLVVGLVCAVLGASCWAISSTISDERTVLNEGSAIATSEPVREAFARQIAEAIAPRSAVATTTELNAANELASRVVDTGAFQQAFVAALPAIYAQVVHGSATDVVLDPGIVNQAFAAAGALPPPNLALTARHADLPDLRSTLDVMSNLALAFGALAALMIGFGLAMAPHRTRAVMRIGRWLITTGLLAIFLFWALPTLALLPLGGWIGVIGILLATGDWLTLPASVMAAFGIAILVLGNAGETEARRRKLEVIPSPVGRSPVRSSIS